tara:strand:- start:617 stop:754 length:138 start_codon:yes stop_codon:yes gene_type:complete
MSLNIFLFTPKTIIETSHRVALCPPLGLGGTPSINGVAHYHFLGS